MFHRLYHVSCLCRSSLKKEAMKLNKLLNPKSKKQWHPPSHETAATLPSLKSLTRVKREPGKQGLRRLAMLNKLFMKSITDLMSTGTVSMDIVGRGIEVSKVQVSSDFRTVNVFWVCKGTSRDEEIETLLSGTAGALRHELSTLRVMGEVPYVVFVKDKQEAQLVELDRRLATADYGEDYTPTEIGHLLKSQFTLDMKLSPEMKAKIKQLEDETYDDNSEEPLPEMTHFVFGLDHEKIMNRLLAARKKSRDAWSNLNDNDTPVISYRVPAGLVPEEDQMKQKQELAEFLLKRQILQNKLHKELRAARADFQLENENQRDDDEEVYYDDHLEDDDDAFYKELEEHDTRRDN